MSKIMDKFGFEMIRSFQVKKQIGIFGTGCDEYVFKLKQSLEKNTNHSIFFENESPFGWKIFSTHILLCPGALMSNRNILY